MDRTWLAAGALLLALGACAKEQPKVAAAPPGPARGTKEWKIQNAMSAGPAAIASGATIMDWAAPGGQMTELRHGTNGWTCMPDVPDSPGNDPMCVDGQFLKWAGAWMSKAARPSITSFGVAYMLQGGTDASNTDPFKMKPDSGQPWVDTGPHVMVVVPNVSALAGVSTDWKSGGPYIMWQGTPFAHVMVPVAPAGHAGMSM